MSRLGAGTRWPLVVVWVATMACGTAGTGQGVAGIEPRDGRSGLSLTGTVDGRQVVVNDGAPRLRLGDCDVNDGPDRDLCFFSRDLNGQFFALVVENPEALAGDSTLPTRDPGCASRCDLVADVAVVDVQFGLEEPRQRAVAGQLRVTALEEGQRYGGSVTLELPDGRLSGTFEVVPRPEPDDEVT